MKIRDIIVEDDVRPQLDDPDVIGVEKKGKSKKATAAGDYDRVIVYLQGKRSEFFSKMALHLKKIIDLKKEMSEEEKQVRANIRQATDELTIPGDALFTRVIDTVRVALTVSKAETRTVEKLDEAGYLAELERMSGLAVEELENIKKRFTTAITVEVEPKVMAPKFKKESIDTLDEGVLDNIKQYISKLKDHVMKFVAQWDRKYNSLKSKIESQL